MAFCPNCGTPNTEQAERCVACGFELIVPKQKAKFKGTIMMSGITAPAAQPEAARAPAAPPPAAPPSTPAPAPAPAPASAPNYKKTMLGHTPITLPAKPEAQPASAPLPASPQDHADLGTMPTMQGQSPLPMSHPAQPSAAPYTGASTRDVAPNLGATNPLGAPPHASSSSPTVGQPRAFTQPTPSYSGSTFSSARSAETLPSQSAGGYESMAPPSAAPNPAKVIAVGCAVVLALVAIVGGALWFAFGDRLRAVFGGGSEASAAEAAAWHASIAQSLTKVNELCTSDCAQAGVFFHPLKQAALLGEARALTPARVAKLNDPATAKATMLDHTDDRTVATQLGLDPQQCARVTAGDAKVISCSVPDPTGKPSVLRIVALTGITNL